MDVQLNIRIPIPIMEEIICLSTLADNLIFSRNKNSLSYSITLCLFGQPCYTAGTPMKD